MAIHHLHTEIEIDASAERVWAVLCDFSSYPQWNPFIKSVTGAPQQGARLQIVVQPSGGKAMRFKPLVLAAEKGRELRWLGRFLVPDRKSTRLNSSHVAISYAVFCLRKKRRGTAAQ